MVRILVKLLLIFVLVFVAVSIWYNRVEENLLKNSAPRSQTVAPPPEKKTEILRKPNDYTIIVSRNIFQAVVVKTEKVTEEIQPEILEPTKLKLTLMGTISGNEKDSRAIISDEVKRQQDIYQVGDSIQGAMIKSVERGTVVLVVNGKDEVLTLKDRQGGGESYTPSPADFYQEPPEQEVPQDLEQEPQQVPDQEVQQLPGQEAHQAPVIQDRRRPVVRPRPVRRPATPSNTGN